MKGQTKPLFIFEMANNHQGSVEHGKNIIKAVREVCNDFEEFDFAFKFQYRDLDTFIHPDFQGRKDIKNVKRFQDTRLSMEQFGELLEDIRKNGFLAICTPFDEISAERIAAQNYEFIKIASCSFTDWPLLEKIAEQGMPVIASGAGSSFEELQNVVRFFSNRNISLTLMHCIAEYPTQNENLQMNQIDFYRKNFPGVRIGFSTHEDPENMLPIKLAVAKGAMVFEKHVGLPTEEIVLNGYSANPRQVRKWLSSAREAFAACGTIGERYRSTPKEREDLAALRRGVFAKRSMDAGHILTMDDIYLAFPCREGQLTACDLSKYNLIQMKYSLCQQDIPIMQDDVTIHNTLKQTLEIMQKLTDYLKEGSVVVPGGSICELSHHYGIDNFYATGVAIIDCVNREYCKKILVILPGQSHPLHYHKKKEETFVILHGELEITLNGEKKILHKGDIVTVERQTEHSFTSKRGCVFEEISTTHYLNDSYYSDAEKFVRPRKTKVHFIKEVLMSDNGCK